MTTERWRVIEHQPVDLSPEAIELRLRDLSQLDELARALRGISSRSKHDLSASSPASKPREAD
jgi:hypothetical protein